MPARSNRYTVTVYSRALEMLEEHMRFLAQVSADAAEQLAVDFSEKAKSLEYMSERGAFFNDPMLPRNTYRKLPVGKRYLLVYLVEGTRVYIDGVFDCRQDHPLIP